MSNHPNRGRDKSNPARNPTPDEIRELRESAGLNQTDAAALLYSSQRAWQEWEAGRRRMHPVFFLYFKLRLDRGDHIA